MCKNINKIIVALITVVCFVSFEHNMCAQFKEKAFTQSYNNDDARKRKDSTDVVFSFKDYFGGLAHKHESKIGVVYAGSIIFLGGQQIYNRDYWKLPIIYGTMAGTIGAGVYFNSKWHDSGNKHDKNMRNLCIAGAGLTYWLTLMDGTINYHSSDPKQGRIPHPGKSTIYSMMFPGMGQAYNGEYWKIPLYYSGLIGSAHFIHVNNKNYRKYKKIHNEATINPESYTGPIPADRALYFRNAYRRLRDYSIASFVIFYLLQIIDANVFAYMHGFEMTDDIAINITPTMINSDVRGGAQNYNSYGYAIHSTYPPYAFGSDVVGIKIGINF